MRGGRQHVAIVAPFFGRDLRGRKERFAFDLATHLALEGFGIDVITTTATPDARDADFFQAGTDHTEPYPVHRFRVDAPDRVAYEDALIASYSTDERAAEDRIALLDERLRSPDLVAHVHSAADRYDAFLFLDVSVTTTVAAIDAVAERALLVPLLDDEPVVRLSAVADAVARARSILCTTEAEAALVAQIYGPSARARTRVVGVGVDTIPAEDLRAGRVERVTAGKPFVLVAGHDREAIAAMRAGGNVAVLEEIDERDRAAFFAFASAIAIAGPGLGFVPEAIEAWSYGKPVLVADDVPGAAPLVLATRGGIVVARGGWTDAIRTLPGDAALALMARGGTDYVAKMGGWERVAAHVADAVDGIAAVDDGRSRDALLAQVAYLYPLVQRQRRTIDAMRVSRFWQLRDAWFAWRKRFGRGPATDPVPPPSTGGRAVELAALGDPYQLFRQQHRLRREDVGRMRAMSRFLPDAVTFAVVIDARGGASDGVAVTLRTLREQIYGAWNARVLVGADVSVADVATFEAFAAEDSRITLVAPGGDRFGDASFVGALDPHDRLERHALFDFALLLQDDVDVIYSDEDRLDAQGVASDPWFKPDWSPETLLTRDYVGRLCMMRRSTVDRAGGVRDVFESAAWYETLLRVSEMTDRVAHVAEVLVHRGAHNAVAKNDLALAVEVALRRRGESGSIRIVPAGIDVRFAVPGDERVCVIVPTRDRADLLRPCIASLFERTAYPAFEVVVVDNGSRERETLALLADWERREPARFRVLRDPSPFNYSRLNNEAVRSTDAPYVVLLNNDTEVIDPDWIGAMLGQARRTQIGAVGALLLYEDGTVQHGGVILGVLGLAGHAHRYLPGTAPGYHGGLQLDTNYLAMTGACLMVAKSKYEQVGGLDESMAVAYNDVDFCLKLHRAGYRNVYVPAARLHHYESKTRGEDDTPAKVARAMREVGELRSRWPDLAVRDPFYNPNLTVDAEDFGFRL